MSGAVKSKAVSAFAQLEALRAAGRKRAFEAGTSAAAKKATTLDFGGAQPAPLTTPPTTAYGIQKRDASELGAAPANAAPIVRDAIRLSQLVGREELVATAPHRYPLQNALDALNDSAWLDEPIVPLVPTRPVTDPVISSPVPVGAAPPAEPAAPAELSTPAELVVVIDQATPVALAEPVAEQAAPVVHAEPVTEVAAPVAEQAAPVVVAEQAVVIEQVVAVEPVVVAEPVAPAQPVVERANEFVSVPYRVAEPAPGSPSESLADEMLAPMKPLVTDPRAVSCYRCSKEHDGVWHSMVECLPFFDELLAVYKEAHAPGASDRWYGVLARHGIAQGDECTALRWQTVRYPTQATSTGIHLATRAYIGLICYWSLQLAPKDFVHRVVVPAIICIHEQARGTWHSLREAEHNLAHEPDINRFADVRGLVAQMTRLNTFIKLNLQFNRDADLVMYGCSFVTQNILGHIQAYKWRAPPLLLGSSDCARYVGTMRRGRDAEDLEQYILPATEWNTARLTTSPLPVDPIPEPIKYMVGDHDFSNHSLYY